MSANETFTVRKRDERSPLEQDMDRLYAKRWLRCLEALLQGAPDTDDMRDLLFHEWTGKYGYTDIHVFLGPDPPFCDFSSALGFAFDEETHGHFDLWDVVRYTKSIDAVCKVKEASNVANELRRMADYLESDEIDPDYKPPRLTVTKVRARASRAIGEE